MTFRTQYGHYELWAMSFGLINAPLVFMDMMIMIIDDYLDQFRVVFIDGILIYFKSREYDEAHQQKALERLR